MSNKIYKKVNKIAIIALLISLAMILSFIEHQIPLNLFGSPVKIGFANIITILAIYLFDLRTAFLITFCRVIILSILFSNTLIFILSIFGFIFSFIPTSSLYYFLSISKNKEVDFHKIILISIFSAVFHNIGQFVALAIYFKNISILKILFPFIILGAFSGFFIGFLSYKILKKYYKI